MKTVVATLFVMAAGAAVACPGDKSAAASADAKPVSVAKVEQTPAVERTSVVSQAIAKAAAQKTTTTR